MSTLANPNLLRELKKYGKTEIESCFNCGNCTAICPLSTENNTFPRRVIRYAGREASASPATGSLREHRREQEALVLEALSGGKESEKS